MPRRLCLVGSTRRGLPACGALWGAFLKTRECDNSEVEYMRFGVHVSIAGSLPHAAERAKKRSCQTFQIFIGNPRSWLSRSFSDEEIKKFKEKCSQYKLKPVIAHTPYLINLSSPNDRLWRMSVRKLIKELERCQQIEVDYLVTHLGSYAGKEEGWGVKRVAEAITQATPALSDEVTLLLENSAGTGYSIGHSFEQLAEIIAFTDNHLRIAICLDTCHAFAAGYDLSNKEGLFETMGAFKKVLGLRRLKLIHANDSRGALGSRIDRHEGVGKGLIGLEGFRELINYSQLKNLPFILETPGMELKEDVRNLKLLRSLVVEK